MPSPTESRTDVYEVSPFVYSSCLRAATVATLKPVHRPDSRNTSSSFAIPVQDERMASIG